MNDWEQSGYDYKGKDVRSELPENENDQELQGDVGENVELTDEERTQIEAATSDVNKAGRSLKIMVGVGIVATGIVITIGEMSRGVIKDMNRTVQGMTSKVQGMNHRMPAIIQAAEDLETVTEDLETINKDLGGITDRAEVVADDLEEIGDDVGTIADDVGTIADDVEVIADDVEKTADKLSEDAPNRAKVEELVEELKKRVFEKYGDPTPK